jgi:magnesium-transporting ATPase (P-type)
MGTGRMPGTASCTSLLLKRVCVCNADCSCRILNFFYKNIVPTGVLWWFQIYNGFSGSFAFDYTYILFWNSFWTLLPVCAIGLFDRFLGTFSAKPNGAVVKNFFYVQMPAS